jgi:hypothetical protein
MAIMKFPACLVRTSAVERSMKRCACLCVFTMKSCLNGLFSMSGAHISCGKVNEKGVRCVCVCLYCEVWMNFTACTIRSS